MVSSDDDAQPPYTLVNRLSLIRKATLQARYSPKSPVSAIAKASVVPYIALGGRQSEVQHFCDHRRQEGTTTASCFNRYETEIDKHKQESSTMSLADLHTQIKVATLVTEKLEHDATNDYSGVKGNIQREFSEFRAVLEKSKYRLQELQNMQRELEDLDRRSARSVCSGSSSQKLIHHAKSAPENRVNRGHDEDPEHVSAKAIILLDTIRFFPRKRLTFSIFSFHDCYSFRKFGP